MPKHLVSVKCIPEGGPEAWEIFLFDLELLIGVTRHLCFRLFGNSGACSACGQSIPASELVMRAQGNVYHLKVAFAPPLLFKRIIPHCSYTETRHFSLV